MNTLSTMFFKAGTQLNLALMNLPRYIVHEDGTYEVVEEAIEAYATEPVSRYVALPARYQYTIPWDIDILYEGIDMMIDLFKFIVPAAFWIFLILTGVHLAFNFLRGMSS